MATAVEVTVRRLRAEDLAQVVAIDAKTTGRVRERYLGLKLSEALAGTGIQASLAAEADGRVRGFLLARVYYGEFGVLEPVAVLDTVGVHPDFRRQRIAEALLRQLRANLLALGVARLRTEVGWDDQPLIAFFHAERFRPAERLCLDLDLAAAAAADERREGAGP
jgi:ribosomal protein S18 acetylase RimI-like enzyme